MRSIRTKLTVVLVLSMLFAVGLVGVTARWITSDQFDRLRVAQARATYLDAATGYYAEHGSWDGVEGALLAAFGGLAAPEGSARAAPPPADPALPASDRTAGAVPAPSEPARPDGADRDRSARWSPFALLDAGGVVVAPGGRYRVGESVPTSEAASATPVTLDGTRIGTVLTIAPPELKGAERLYLRRTGQALLYASVAAGLLAVLLGLLSTRLFLRPIRAITDAIRNMRGGALEQRVEVHTRDEFGEMAHAFNEMSAEVARGQRLRRQMTADIAHELRTPLSVLGGYLEAMRDGVLDPTPSSIEAMHDEALHLQRLVEDLRTLSLADSGELALDLHTVDARTLLDGTEHAFAPLARESGVTLRSEPGGAPAWVRVDATRLRQVLANLVSNSLRFTSAGGHVRLGASVGDRTVTLEVADDGSGIPEAEQRHLFERFYRVDAARSVRTGTSGLGLAIVRSLVEAHGGTVALESAQDRGTTVRVTLPRAPDPAD